MKKILHVKGLKHFATARRACMDAPQRPTSAKEYFSNADLCILFPSNTFEFGA